MAAEEVKRFEAHVRGCISCLKAIAWVHAEHRRAKERAENELLLRRTMSLVDELIPAAQARPALRSHDLFDKVVHIALRVSRETLKVLRTTGELLSPPMTPAFRGKTGVVSLREKSEVKVLQEFTEPPLSAQISFEKGGGETGIHLRISLFNRESDEFLCGVEARLDGLGASDDTMSDENGEVHFTIRSAGNYVARLYLGGKPLIQLVLPILDR